MNEKFQQHVDGIKRRWPTIGAHLDHPLAEVIFAEVQRQSKTALFKKCLKTCIGVTVAIAAFYAIIYATFNTIRSNIIMNGVIVWIVVVSQSIARLRAQGPIKLFENKNFWSLRDVWLAGIGYDDMLAIWIMLRVYRPHPQRRFLAGSMLLLAGCAASVYITATKQAFTVHAWVLIVSGFMIIQSVYYYSTHVNTVAIQAISRFSQVVKGRHDPLNTVVQIGVITAVWFVLAFGGFVMIFFLFMSIRPSLSRIPILVLLWVGATILFGISVFIVYFASCIQRRRVRYKFAERCRSGRKQYIEIINAESELPVN